MRFEKIAQMAGMAVMATGLALAQTSGSGTTPPAQNAQQRHGKMLDRIAQKLGLTDDQKAQAKTIFENAQTEAQPYRTQLKTAHQAFRTALQNNASDADLQKAADNQALVMSKLNVIHAKAMRDFEKILTPDQLAKAKEMRAFMMGRFGRRGFGFGG